MSVKARIVGINHVALEVGNIEEALSFYGKVFDFSLRGRSDKMAFIDMGDQFIALFEGHGQHYDQGRHFGLVVDDKNRVREQLQKAGVTLLPGRGVEFRDPWGNQCSDRRVRERAVREAPRRAEWYGLPGSEQIATSSRRTVAEGNDAHMIQPSGTPAANTYQFSAAAI